jgi:hypothetical protein
MNEPELGAKIDPGMAFLTHFHLVFWIREDEIRAHNLVVTSSPKVLSKSMMYGRPTVINSYFGDEVFTNVFVKKS